MKYKLRRAMNCKQWAISSDVLVKNNLKLATSSQFGAIRAVFCEQWAIRGDCWEVKYKLRIAMNCKQWTISSEVLVRPAVWFKQRAISSAKWSM